MQPAHNSGPNREAPISQAAPADARGQTDARTLLCCMRTKSRCGLHQGPPRAAHSLRRMSAGSSTPKPPKAADANGDLAALGFRVAGSGPHTSKTLMLQELVALLAEVSIDATAKAYRVAIVDENAWGKRTLSARKETASLLRALHGLDPTKPLFRALRRLWDVAPTAGPQLPLLSQLTCAHSCVGHLPPASVVTPTSVVEG